MSTTHGTKSPATPSPSIPELIEEALSACRTLPPPERLVELDGQIRTELARLKPIVQQQAARLSHGTVDWWKRQRAVDATHNALAEPRCEGASPLPAAMLVAELGRRLVELDRYANGQPT